MVATDSKTQDCPYCKEEIKSDAVKCKHCGSMIGETKPFHEGTCPYCKEAINPAAIKCKHCQSNLVTAPAVKSIEPNTMQGLGDVVSRATTFFGVKPCTGCKRRQEKLNTLFPFSRYSNRQG